MSRVPKFMLFISVSSRRSASKNGKKKISLPSDSFCRVELKPVLSPTTDTFGQSESRKNPPLVPPRTGIGIMPPRTGIGIMPPRTASEDRHWNASEDRHRKNDENPSTPAAPVLGILIGGVLNSLVLRSMLLRTASEDRHRKNDENPSTPAAPVLGI